MFPFVLPYSIAVEFNKLYCIWVLLNNAVNWQAIHRNSIFWTHLFDGVR